MFYHSWATIAEYIIHVGSLWQNEFKKWEEFVTGEKVTTHYVNQSESCQQLGHYGGMFT